MSEVKITADFDITPNEKDVYVNYVKNQLGAKADTLSTVSATLNKETDEVTLNYSLDNQKFERIRRIN